MEESTTDRPPLALSLLLAIAAAKLGLHLLSSGPLAYGYFADELYYVDCANHLAWGYVDHPPLSIAILRGITALLGTSLFALRLFPALAGAAVAFLCGMMARELGGGRAAQGFAALSVAVAPLFLFVGSFYSMNAFEPLLWAITALLMMRIFNGGRPSTWLAVGVVLGLSLLNKVSTLWFGAGLFIGLLLSEQRHWLRTAWPWTAGVVAALIFVPHLDWQISHDWPTYQFMQNGRAEVMVAVTRRDFIAEQIAGIHPLVLPFVLCGLATLLLGRLRAHAAFAWTWLSTAAILMASGTARPYYLLGVYSPILAAGGVVVERFTRRFAPRAAAPILASTLIAAGLLAAPLALPLLPPEAYIAYERRIGDVRAESEFEEGVLPVQFAFRFGWRRLVEAVAEAYRALPDHERGRAGILTLGFPAGGAVNFFGPELRLPRAIGTHNNYWLWGTHEYDGEIMIAVAESDQPLHRIFGTVERVGDVDCTYCSPELRKAGIFLCRDPHRPLEELWPEVKNFS